MPPLRTSSSGAGQDSWGSQSRAPSAGETSISDFIHRPVEVQLPHTWIPSGHVFIPEHYSL